MQSKACLVFDQNPCTTSRVGRLLIVPGFRFVQIVSSMMNVFRRITSALKSNMEIFDALTNEVHFLFRICLENILGS